MVSYQFKTNIPQKEYDDFVQHHPLCNLLQSYDWAKVKSNWGHLYTGVYENGKLVASGLVLIKKLPLSFTMFYIPKGPILDYENKELLQFYFDHLKKIAQKHHCIFIKLDPGIIVREFTLKEQDIPMAASTQTVIQNLSLIGAVHKGFTIYISQTVQPRFHMGLKPCDLNEHLPKSTMRSIKKAQKKNVFIEEAGVQGLDAFSEIMHMTEERKQVRLRGRDYFQLLLETYPNSHLYLAYVDPLKKQKELKEKEKMLEERIQNKPSKKTENDLRQVQEELKSIEEVCQKYPHKTAIAGGLMIGYGNQYEMLYAGSNDDFMNFRPQYLLYQKQFEYAFEHGAEFVTMGGVDGDFKDGLSEFKSNFDPLIHEYIGEFDLPIHKVLYFMAMKALPYVKKGLRKKLMHRNRESFTVFSYTEGMKIQRIRALYWSATGNTKKVIRYMARCFSLPVFEQDFTLPDARKENIVCSKEELVLIGLPTYAGKLPNKILPFVKEKIQGNSTLAVPVVTFGNRNFDHSLAELCMLLKDNHFIPIGACALSCQHAFSSRLAYARPSESDWEELDHFLMNVQKKLDQGPPFDLVVPGDARAPYYVPKKEDGSPARFLKAKPIVDKTLCTGCRVCAHLCPMGSIDTMDPSLTPGVCIKCQRCIHQCPQKARSFQDPDFLSHVKMLEMHYTKPRANQFFF